MVRGEGDAYGGRGAAGASRALVSDLERAFAEVVSGWAAAGVGLYPPASDLELVWEVDAEPGLVQPGDVSADVTSATSPGGGRSTEFVEPPSDVAPPSNVVPSSALPAFSGFPSSPDDGASHNDDDSPDDGASLSVGGSPDVGASSGDGAGAGGVGSSVPWWAAVPTGAAPVPTTGPVPAPGDAALVEALTRGLVDGEADAAGAAALEALPGGPVLASTLAALSPAGAGDATLIEGVAAFERLASWAMARQAVLVRELTDRQGMTSRAADRAAAEIGARLGSTGTVGAMKVGLAAALDSFPEVADALSSGRIDARKASVLTTREPGLSTREQRRVVTGLLRDAPRLSGPKLRNRLRAAALSVNPDAGAQRRKGEHAARKVTITAAPDAMAWITAYVRADHAHTIKTALGALAAAAVDGDPAETRTRDQVRADAFVDLFASVLDRGVDLAGHPLPTGTRARAGAQITVGAGTLLGLDSEAGYLAGYGPIPAELARELAQDATWRALLTDEHGHFKDLSTRAYRPGADLTRTVKARDVTCTFPGCTRPSVVCDLDHRIEYDPAIAHLVAQTSVCNLHPLCRHHHNLKTSKHWHVTREADGTEPPRVPWRVPSLEGSISCRRRRSGTRTS